MKIAGRILASALGALLVWMAVSMALGDGLIAPSATQDGRPPLEVTRTWYGELMRFAAAGLLGFFGVTLAVAPWRRGAGRAS